MKTISAVEDCYAATDYVCITLRGMGLCQSASSFLFLSEKLADVPHGKVKHDSGNLFYWGLCGLWPLDPSARGVLDNAIDGQVQTLRSIVEFSARSLLAQCPPLQFL